VKVWAEGGRWRKKPHIEKWAERSTTNRTTIEQWWRSWPEAFVGVALARVGLVCLDADRHGDGQDGVAALREIDLPPHPIDITISDGEHHLFRQPDPPIPNLDWEGGDVLSIGRLIVAYSLEPFITPAPVLPPDLLGRLPKKARNTPASGKETPMVCVVVSHQGVSPHSREGRYARVALRNAFGELANWPHRIKKGEEWVLNRGRNKCLNALAYKQGRLVANGWVAEAEVVRVLMLAARSCGLLREDGEAQCRATIQSGLKAGMLVPYPALI
jgi:Bifunctional DNA primase/polymerase, N-terminal